MNANPQARIGIALAAYQPNVEFLKAQLESLIAQTHSNWICHITCDSPVKPIGPFDQRIRWNFNPERLGHARNFERALSLCAADPEVVAIAFCDQDDIWLPTKLASSLQILATKPPLSLVHCDLAPFIGEPPAPDSALASLWKLERRGHEEHSPLEQMIRCTVNGTAALFDGELARKYPKFPVTVRHHDQWMAVLAAAHGGIHPVHEILVLYRQHGANVSGINPYRGFLEMPSSPLARIRERNRELEDIVRAANQIGIDITRLNRRYLLKLALNRWTSDPVLARASLAKWVGSFPKIEGVKR